MFVGGDGVLARWAGARWSGAERVSIDELISVSGNSAGEVWAVGARGDVWAVGRDVRHWNGKECRSVELGSTASFRAVVGDGKGTVWILARGPRPEETDGPSTGLPDEVIQVSPTGATRWLEPRDRPDALAFASGALWTLGGAGGLQRFDGKSWLKDPKLRMARPHSLLETRAGPLLVGTDGVWWLKDAVWTWDQPENGRDMFHAWSSSSEVFAVGRDGLLLRWAAP